MASSSSDNAVPQPLLAHPYIATLKPPRELLSQYDASVGPDKQQPGSNIPAVFLDAMRVREQVFVQEQGIPLENEFDSDDARSVHFVMYSTFRHPDNDLEMRELPMNPGDPPRIPIGTLRLVPFPHTAHPLAGRAYVDGKLVPILGVDDSHVPTGLLGYNTDDSATKHHDGQEPYYKLGRLAIIPSRRGRHLASALIHTAMRWAMLNNRYFNPPDSDETPRGDDRYRWRGLFCAHAQVSAIHVWNRMSFVEDERMGRWLEEGIAHVGMWCRVNDKDAPVPAHMLGANG